MNSQQCSKRSRDCDEIVSNTLCFSYFSRQFHKKHAAEVCWYNNVKCQVSQERKSFNSMRDKQFVRNHYKVMGEVTAAHLRVSDRQTLPYLDMVCSEIYVFTEAISIVFNYEILLLW